MESFDPAAWINNLLYSTVGSPEEERPIEEEEGNDEVAEVQWQEVGRGMCRCPRAGNAWLLNSSFKGGLEEAKQQAFALGGAHFTKYEHWLQVVGNDSVVLTLEDTSAVLYSQASAAWTPLGESPSNVDRAGSLRFASSQARREEIQSATSVSNFPAKAVSFRVSGAGAQCSVGLAIGTSGQPNSHFMLICDEDRSIFVSHGLNETDATLCGTNSDKDVLAIEHTGSEIVFRRNEQVLFTSMFNLTPGEEFYAYATVRSGGEMRGLLYDPVAVKPSLSFSMYRFTPTRLRSDSATAVQITEIRFRRRGPPGAIVNTRNAVASNPGGQNPASEGPEMAIDSKLDTKWLDLNIGALVVQFPNHAYPNAVAVDEFCFVTANNHVDRDPVQWKLEASITGMEWTALHVQSFYYDTPRQRKAQTAWFPFNTVGVVQETPAPSPAAPDHCLVTRTAFEAQISGATYLTWQEFCNAAGHSSKKDRSHVVGLLTRIGAFLLNLLIWCALTVLGTHRSRAGGLMAVLTYSFALRVVLAHCLQPDAQPWAERTAELWMLLRSCARSAQIWALHRGLKED